MSKSMPWASEPLPLCHKIPFLRDVELVDSTTKCCMGTHLYNIQATEASLGRQLRAVQEKV